MLFSRRNGQQTMMRFGASRYRFFKKRGIAFICKAMPLFFLVLQGCHQDSGSTSAPQAMNYIELDGAVDAAQVRVTTSSGETMVTTSHSGEWGIPLAWLPENDSEKIYVETRSGRVGNAEINGTLAAWVDVKGLREGSVTLDAVTTFAAFEAANRGVTEQNLSRELDALARALLYEEANGSADFRTLYACGQSDACTAAGTRLYSVGFDALIFRGSDMQRWLDNDDDGDGIANSVEVVKWLLPNNADTDHDTLNDGDEVYRYGTSARKSDSDSDYIPDAIELSMGSDPNDADENVNAIADGLEGDPFFRYEWHLYNPVSAVICNTAGIATVAGNDLGMLPLYHQTWGALHAPQTVQVVDGGVDYPHEDIAIDLNRSWNSITRTNDPTPTEGIGSEPVQIFYRGHGTAVAGIIAAKAKNGIGVRGVAPQVRIAGSNWLESEKLEALADVWLGADATMTISNNSWGARYLKESVYDPLLEEGATHLRNGKGRLFVFAAGNDREKFGNANLSYLINNPYVITVAAVNHEERVASYSSPGANVLVSAYGGEHFYTAPTIMTTFTPGAAMDEATLNGQKGPITLDEDTQKSYTYAMNGTSAAAPMVSGALALVLDLCPALGYRDVIRLIALTARRIDKQNGTWVENGAGLWHSNDYGFGMIDPEAMVHSCQGSGFAPLPPQQSVTVKTEMTPVAIPDDNTSIEFPISVDADLTLEWVGITLDIDHPYAGDLAVDLISPAGTVSRIIDPNFINFNAYSGGFRFASLAFKEEESAGTWTLRIRDALKEDSGIVQGIELMIKGY